MATKKKATKMTTTQFANMMKDRSSITMDKFPSNIRSGQTKTIIKPLKNK